MNSDSRLSALSHRPSALGSRRSALGEACPARSVGGARLSTLVAGAMIVAVGVTAGAQPAARELALKGVFANDFRMGAALNADQFFERDTLGAALVQRHFNSITPENVLKWERVHPDPRRYDFAEPDRFVAFGEKHGMFIVGHTLVWHSQTPRWVFQDSTGQALSRDALLERMRDHIHTVVGRYKGRIKGWDVVNEALNEDGTLRQSPWMRIIGEDYIEKAFRFAQEVDPAAELYYNDYSLANPAKRDGAVRLVRALQAAGIRVAGIGTQEHHKLDWPSPALVDSMFAAFRSLGVKVHVTELDIDVLPRPTAGADVSSRTSSGQNPFAAGLPDSTQRQLAQRYGDMFAVYLKHRDILDRVTFWGVRDGDSWLNGWPVRGRTNHPLLFDRAGQTKPAFQAVIDAATRARGVVP
jgi:endo-1,4-beta-xylanase